MFCCWLFKWLFKEWLFKEPRLKSGAQEGSPHADCATLVASGRLECMSLHSVARLFVHFVWTTKHRVPTIEPEHDARLHQLISDAAASVECELIAVGNASDHVHVVVRVSAKASIAALAQRLKGRTSYFGGWRWQRGYFAECVATSDLVDKIAYVRNQRRHHPHSAEGGVLVASDGPLPMPKPRS